MTTLAITSKPLKPPFFQGLSKILVASLAVLSYAASALESISAPAGPDGPAQIAYVPAKSPAPTVILLSGQSGTAAYQDYAAEVAGLGYYAVLVDGKDNLTRTQDGNANLKKTIERAQQSPHAAKGKSAVIAFSQGVAPHWRMPPAWLTRCPWSSCITQAPVG